MKFRHAVTLLVSLFFVALLHPLVGLASSISTFSGGGFMLPETVTPIPPGFGTVGGGYFVPDYNANMLFVVPAGGGAPTAFANLPPGFGGLISGLFVPAGYGTLSGQFLMTGATDSSSVGATFAVSASGVVTQVYPRDFFRGSASAPLGFGTVGGKILVGDDTGTPTLVSVLNADGTTSQLATLDPAGNFDPFGMGFAPATFGAIGGKLLVTDGNSGKIDAVDSSGNVSLFATLPVPAGTSIGGLRQFAFAPAGFGIYGGDLFVSVSGSTNGGGTLGVIDVLDSSGNLIANLLQGSVGAPFDPRGLYFVSNNQLLIADSDPSILSAPPSVFTVATPEPVTIGPVLLFLSSLIWRKSRRA